MLKLKLICNKNQLIPITLLILIFSLSYSQDFRYELGNLDVQEFEQIKLIASEAIFIDSSDDFITYGFNGSGLSSDPYVIANLSINTAEDYGIYVGGITEYFIILGCTIDAYLGGIYIENLPSGIATIFDNTCNFIKGGSGISFVNVVNCTIKKNSLINNKIGIYGHSSSLSQVKENDCKFNTEEGTRFDYCTEINIENNTMINNYGRGVHVENSNYMEIKNNTMYNNFIGIYFNVVNELLVIDNWVDHHLVGIHGFGSMDGLFVSNFIYDSDSFGMSFGEYLVEGPESLNNEIYHNYFVGNNLRWYTYGSQAYDYANQWYDSLTLTGNYWSDYRNETSFYELAGENTDPYPILAPDSDADDLDDIVEEYIYFTDSLSNDTDSDNLTDGEEVLVYFTDALNIDSDFDQLEDGEEIYVYFTSPTNGDSDLDGLEDGAEVYDYGTNPTDIDSDDDLMEDGYEVFNDLNPTLNDSFEDLDSDGLINLEEFNLKTEANNNDTDGDLLLDGDEVLIYLTDAKHEDSDYDGLNDGEEIFTYLTSPTNDDSDFDGLEDGEEVLTHHTNPLSEDSDSDGMDDYWEVLFGLNPLLDDGEGDLDEDYLTNLEEYDHKTFPNDPDTDGDSYTDFEELNYGTDPLDYTDYPSFIQENKGGFLALVIIPSLAVFYGLGYLLIKKVKLF